MQADGSQRLVDRCGLTFVKLWKKAPASSVFVIVSKVSLHFCSVVFGGISELFIFIPLNVYLEVRPQLIEQSTAP